MRLGANGVITLLPPLPSPPPPGWIPSSYRGILLRTHGATCQPPSRGYRGLSAWGAPILNKGSYRAGGRQALGRTTELLGCGAVCSSRGNKLCTKGAFERQVPCRAGVLLWHAMLNAAPEEAELQPPAHFHRAVHKFWGW